MRFVRLLGVVIMFYGVSFLQFGAVQFYEAIYYRPVRVNWYIIASNVNIGLVIAVTGIGLIFAKEWARIFWLMSTIALIALEIYLLVMTIVDEARPGLQLLNVILLLLLSVISWVKLTRPEVKELFH